jgi:hypothetical protein
LRAKVNGGFENPDPELERLVMPFDIPDQFVARFVFVSFAQKASVESL